MRSIQALFFVHCIYVSLAINGTDDAANLGTSLSDGPKTATSALICCVYDGSTCLKFDTTCLTNTTTSANGVNLNTSTATTTTPSAVCTGCAPYACTEPVGCFKSCTLDGQCASGFQCNDGSCSCNPNRCGSYVCDATAGCKSSCTNSLDCKFGSFCYQSSCVSLGSLLDPGRLLNSTCDLGFSCSLGTVCIQGVCTPRCDPTKPCPGNYTCDALTGICNSRCDPLFNDGILSSCYDGYRCDPSTRSCREKDKEDLKCSNGGECGLFNRCLNGTCCPNQCDQRRCLDNSVASIPGCNGMQCVSTSQFCYPYVCTGGSCLTSCLFDAHCQSGLKCSQGNCINSSVQSIRQTLDKLLTQITSPLRVAGNFATSGINLQVELQRVINMSQNYSSDPSAVSVICDPLSQISKGVSSTNILNMINQICGPSDSTVNFLLNSADPITVYNAQIIVQFLLTNRTKGQLFSSLDKLGLGLARDSTGPPVVLNTTNITMVASRVQYDNTSSMYVTDEYNGYDLPAEVLMNYNQPGKILNVVYSLRTHDPANGLNLVSKNISGFVANVTGLSLFNEAGVKLQVTNTSQMIDIYIKCSSLSDAVCMWWNPVRLNWDTEGCTTTVQSLSSNLVRCSCNHLTNFTVGQRIYTTSSSTATDKAESTRVSSITLVIILGSVGAALAVGILVLFLILMRTKRIEREYSPVNVIFEENSIQDKRLLKDKQTGAVYLGNLAGTFQVVLKPFIDTTEADRTMKTTRRMKHLNVLCMVGIYKDVKLYGVHEYANGGNLEEFFGGEGKKMSYAQRVQLLRGIIGGLHHMKSVSVVHCTLSYNSIYIQDGKITPKIGDFLYGGLAGEVIRAIPSTTLQKYSTQLAPEVVEQQRRSFTRKMEPAIDVYGLGGIISFVMKNGQQMLTRSRLTLVGSKRELIYLNSSRDGEKRDPVWSTLKESCRTTSQKQRL
ncbi:hypothetical protein PROFUN_00287 [Planoprotostelium fungivorum]|uniref:Uncharacterized protein n=1 Tax=Planoprotostelium fungivorum TaxID=1890364 RepID=A0A2P6NY00_9EUKA|nr:hypothetical protein PROFUN_00287 [Planoprotostelium fungivorum]